TGELEFLGRRDHQVKIRGQRIELGEVENALRDLPGITDAVVIAHTDPNNQTRLAAYTTGPLSPAQTRTALATTLPETLIPTHITTLDTMPLTPNGKIDRAALPTPDLTFERTPYRAPGTLEERLLAELFAEVLGVEEVGLDDDFFTLGGHSLLATQLIARIRSDFGVQLPLRTLFETPALEPLAAEVTALIAEGAHDGAHTAGVETLLAEIEHLSDEEVEALLSGSAGPAQVAAAAGPAQVAPAAGPAQVAPAARPAQVQPAAGPAPAAGPVPGRPAPGADAHRPTHASTRL
ncbi:phosphopantetheine-binding protein, partial [Streptomyces griseus]